MTDFSNLVDKMNDPYLRNEDGSYLLDKIGRKRHIAQIGKGIYKRGKGVPAELVQCVTIRMTVEMFRELDNIRGKMDLSSKIREYIEWGLENDGL